MKIARDISFKEYLLESHFKKKVRKKVTIFTIVLALFSAITIGSIPVIDILIFFVSMFLVGIILIYSLTLIIDRICYASLKKQKKLKYDITFYDTYIQITRNHKMDQIEYQKIKIIKENTDDFILILNGSKLSIKKKECNNDLVNFLRNLKHQKEEKLLEDKSYQNMKRRMKSLFIFTLLSLWLALLSVALITSILGTNIYNIKFMWIMWLWLPVPITSIILGIKYKRLGMKCVKNIIGGFVIAFLLIIYGCFIFIPDNEIDYQEVQTLEEILNIHLPESGKYYRTSWNNKDLENNIIHDIYFTNKEEYVPLEENIKQDSRWILKENLKSQLELLIPNNMSCQEKYTCYYALYIKETEQYNKLPEVNGSYHIYAMAYVLETHQLRVEEYDYDYKI